MKHAFLSLPFLLSLYTSPVHGQTSGNGLINVQTGDCIMEKDDGCTTAEFIEMLPRDASGKILLTEYTGQKYVNRSVDPFHVRPVPTIPEGYQLPPHSGLRCIFVCVSEDVGRPFDADWNFLCMQS